MSISLGGQSVRAIAHGAVSIQRIHRGNTLIYDRSGQLPTITRFTITPDHINLDQQNPPTDITIDGGASLTNVLAVFNKATGIRLREVPLGGIHFDTPRPSVDTTYVLHAYNTVGQVSRELTVEVNKTPSISNFRASYGATTATHGRTVRFDASWDGSPVPTFSANHGIGSITARHINLANKTIQFSHYFGVSGNYTIRLTARNRQNSRYADVRITIP